MSLPKKLTDNQSLDGANLDLALLDHRVELWKQSCGLVFQDNFPPRTCEISDGGLKFHDRTHILIQDFLGLDSWDLQQVFNETSIPSVFEEILTFFGAKILHSLDDDAQKFVSIDMAKSDIQAMKHLEYIDDDSILITQRVESATKIKNFLADVISKPGFEVFRKTLKQSTVDCVNWNSLLFV
jgi:hypothetical protein